GDREAGRGPAARAGVARRCRVRCPQRILEMRRSYALRQHRLQHRETIGLRIRIRGRVRARIRMAQATTKIEDYGFISDTQTGALVSRDGCVDWLCFPRFDSPACFASLLGEKENGHWRFFPKEEVTATRRRYRGETLILETELETANGAVRLIDFMPPRGENPEIIRIIEGLRGKVSMRMELIIRFDYGHIEPAVRKSWQHEGFEAIAGPDGLIFRSPVKTKRGKDRTVAEFTVAKGDRIPFVLTWFLSHTDPPRTKDPEEGLRDTERFWLDWTKDVRIEGKWRDAVVRSLIHWQDPDEGIWEVRGGRQHFTHSKIMAWLAFDRAIKLVENNHEDAPSGHVDRWRKTRDQIH